jgi:hypothetical protein
LEARRAHVGGGASWAAVDAETVPHGLAVVGGTVSHTGVAGLTLSGGWGWLTSQQGLACDNLVAATLVTAHGRTVTVSDQAEPDLMWALRGAGTNFGVVTELVFDLHEVDPMANLGLFFWPVADAAAQLAFAREYLFELPKSMSAVVAASSAPPEPFVPEQHRGTPGIAVLVVNWGSAEEHAAAVAPLRARAPLFELVTPLPYVALQQMLDNAEPWGIHGYAKSLNFDDLPDEAIAILLDRLPRRRSPMSEVPMFTLRGRYSEIPDDATAWGSPRSARWAAALLGLAWDEELRRRPRLGPRPVAGAAAVRLRRGRVSQLRERHRGTAGACLVRGGEVPPTGRPQGRMGPGERISAQPERRTGLGPGTGPPRSGTYQIRGDRALTPPRRRGCGQPRSTS